MQPFWVLPYALRHRAGRLAHEAQVASSCCCISSCRAVCPFHFFFEALCSIFACPLSGRVPDFLALALIGLCADSSLPLAFVIGM